MSVSEIRALLEKHGLRLHRDRGQNFLVDESLAERLARVARVGPGDAVIEIGTGLGALTRALAARAARVVSIEVDAGLVDALRSESLLPSNVELLHADALRLDLGELARQQGRPVRVVANLPYSAATPLLRRLLDWRDSFLEWAVTVQRELGERLLALPGEKDYGSLAVLHHACVDARRELELNPRCFFPAPQVRSRFVRVVPRRPSPLAAGELEQLERVARSVFGQRRKTVWNALRGSPYVSVRDEAGVERALRAAGIEPGERAERIAPEKLLALARALEEVDPSAFRDAGAVPDAHSVRDGYPVRDGPSVPDSDSVPDPEGETH